VGKERAGGPMGSRLINNGQCIMTIRSTAVAVPDSLEAHIRDRVARLGRFGWSFTHVAVEIAHERNPRIADIAFSIQITCRSPRLVVRAESAAATAAAAFDACIERLHARLRRLADKERSRRRLRSSVEAGAAGMTNAALVGVRANAELDDNGRAGARRSHLDGEIAPLIVRDKRHPWRPMTAVEAIEAMELVGHSFYLFIDSDSGQPAVVYQRKAYTYGVVKLGEGADFPDRGVGETVNHGEQTASSSETLEKDAQVMA